ncbi:MAG: OPT/YSL family transporter [Candidatus Methanofastidiosia archaeon]|jgi:uncharacterized oligopeptide transporter (OPT) family protein
MIDKSFTVRSLVIGLLFGSLVAAANIFLTLTVGIMVTAAMVSVVALFAFSSFFKKDTPTTTEAVYAYTVHKAAAFAFSIFPIVWVFLIAYDIPRAQGLRIPDWILPDATLYENVLRDGVIFSRSWVTPLAWMLPVAIVSGIVALIVVIWMRDHYIKEEDMAFPQAEADIQLIKGIVTEKFRLDYLFYGLVIGFFFDFFLIHYPVSFGYVPQWLREISQHLQLLDFTPYITSILPGGMFCIVVSIGFLGIGMLMAPKSSFNMAGSAVLFYIGLSAVLVGTGALEGAGTFGGMWPAFRYPYGLSLALGLLLTAVLAPLVLKAVSPLISEAKREWKRPPLVTFVVFGIFCAAVFILVSVLSIDRFVGVYPLSRLNVVIITVVMLVTFVLGILIKIRIAGETGIVWLSLYTDITDFVRRWAVLGMGKLGFEGFAITESFRGALFAGGQMEALKVGSAFDANPRHQYVSALVGWCFGWLISTPIVFLIWHYYGVGRGVPMPNMQGMANVVVAFATGNINIVFSPWFIFFGFVIGGVLFFLKKRGLPFVVTAVGIGAFVGPIYVTTFFIGGLIRYVMEKVKGTTWVDEKGKPFSAGLVLGGIALAPLLMVVVNVVVLVIGGG